MNEVSEEKAAFMTGAREPRLIYVEKAYVMVVDPGPLAPRAVTTVNDQLANIERRRLLTEAASIAGGALLREFTNPT